MQRITGILHSPLSLNLQHHSFWGQFLSIQLNLLLFFEWSIKILFSDKRIFIFELLHIHNWSIPIFWIPLPVNQKKERRDWWYLFFFFENKNNSTLFIFLNNSIYHSKFEQLFIKTILFLLFIFFCKMKFFKLSIFFFVNYFVSNFFGSKKILF